MRVQPRVERLVISAGTAGILAALLAIAACGSSGNTYTAPSGLSKCSVTFDTPQSPVPAAGGPGSIVVKTERECQWTAQPDVSWLSITAGSSGQGDGSVQFTASANGDPVARSGGIMLNGLRAQVTQAAADCRLDLSQSGASFPQAGGTGTVDVRASSQLCTWTTASDSDWIAITSGASGKGSAPVAFTVAPTTGPPRTGTLTIAGVRFSVTQSEGCTYAIAPTAYNATPAGGSTVIAVTAGAGCPWTALSNANWVTVSPESGAGPGTVSITVAPTSGPPRTGMLTVAGQTFTVTQSAGCTADVSPLSHTADSGGGTRSVTVNTGAGCPWAAVSNASWLTITGGASGSGSGTVTFSIASTSGPARSGTLTIAGQTVTVTQGQGCTLAISPDTQSIPSAGGNGAVSVTGGAGCPWTASSNASWITIAAGSASGSGNGTVNFTVAATNGPGRAGTMTIAGKTFTVNQGQGCSFTLSSQSATAPAGGASGSFDVRTADGCAWSASPDDSWLSITAGATGTGNGTVRYTASANAGPQRSGTIKAGGHTFTVNQDAGCTYSIAPTSQNAGAGGGNAAVTVTAPGGCSWSASSNASWIGVSSGGSGSGNGTVQLVIAASSDPARSGTATIAGQTFTVNQASGCTVGIAPTSQTMTAAGGTGSFNVTASGSCGWTATPNMPWISVTGGASGSGNGTVQFSVAPNTGGARSGAITAAGQTFTITQDAGCSYSVTPDTIPVGAPGGSPTVAIATANECTWAATSNVPWIAITIGASGTGNGTSQLDVQANTGPARNGTATVAGRTVTVNQDSGCTYSIAPTSQPVAVGGGPGTVTVTTGAGCTWAATSNATWIKITAGESGAGGGPVQFTVDPNATGAARDGTLTIAGQPFTVSQAGS